MRGAVALLVLSLVGAAQSSVRTTVGPSRLVVPGFGYTVVYRAVETGTHVTFSVRLLVDDAGLWRNATPPAFARDRIDLVDDVAFIDRSDGWLAAFNCARAAVFVYRTRDGGRTWEGLGSPSGRSCGGGPSYLSFADRRHGWLEPVSPNAPSAELLGTTDGGRTWTQRAEGPPGQVPPPALPCLGPIRFVSPARGWLGRCGDGRLYTTADGGRRWAPVAIPLPRGSDARFDLPWLAGGSGVLAATLGTRPPGEDGLTRAVAFAVSRDGGLTWSVVATRRVARCPLPSVAGPWPTAVAGARDWWIAAGGSPPVFEVTTDAGLTWRRVVARGLPSGACAVVSVSAAGARTAWVVARTRAGGSALFRTADGGRTWKRGRDRTVPWP
jgi:photosystem II stability/assembly factor-like uncharacterized protein